MATSPLKKATRNGFTVLPNKIIDDILQSSGKNVADTLALLIYCVRHIPSQSGTLSLHGNFSQTAICTDLGWGPTNKQRLKRACQHLESAGVLTQELRDNNVLLFHIKAELELQNPDDKQAGRGDYKNSQPAAKIPCDQGIKIPSTPYIENKYINNSQENLLGQPSIKKTETSEKTAANQAQDDDLEKLCHLYRELLRKPITPKHREIFANTYRENASPYTLVDSAIRTIAKHPKLHKDTVSINAVWQLPFMLRSARQFEANVRELLHNLKEGGVQDLEHRILRAAKESSVDIDIFKAFFADDILEATGKNQRSHQIPAQKTPDVTTQRSSDNLAPTQDQNLDSTPTTLPTVAEKAKPDQKSDTRVVVTQDVTDPVSGKSKPQTVTLCGTQPEPPNQCPEHKVIPLRSIVERPQSICQPDHHKGKSIIEEAEQFIKAKTKVEFLALIKATLESPTLATRDKEILTSLVELTHLPNSTLSMLQKSVAHRFRLRKAS